MTERERPSVGDIWYRIEDGSATNWVREFRVEKVTPQGVWLSDGFSFRRLVLEGAKKRFACPTMDEAMVSFVRRKTRQLSILLAQTKRVERALEEARSGAPIGSTRLTDGFEELML